MDNQFFEKPVLDSPYDYPGRHWVVDGAGQPIQHIVEIRRQGESL